jgi:hypothetical protein
MRPFSVEWHELMIAAAIFVAAMIAFAFLSSVAGWPNAASGWGSVAKIWSGPDESERTWVQAASWNRPAMKPR